jgi:hypothetical protein
MLALLIHLIDFGILAACCPAADSDIVNNETYAHKKAKGQYYQEVRNP